MLEVLYHCRVNSPHISLPSWLERTLIVSLGLILLLMPVHAFFSTWGGTAIGPLWLWKSWKEILLAVVATATVGWLVSNPGARRAVLGDRLAQLVTAFAGLCFVLAAFHLPDVGAAATSAGLASDLRYMIMASLAFVLFRFGNLDWAVTKKRVLTALVTVGAILGIVGLLQVTVLPRDLLTHFGYDKDLTIAPFMVIDENPDAPRAFATLRGPNEFGAFLILPLVAGLLFVARKKWEIAAALLASLGILLSVSRSAWLGALAAVVALMALTYGSDLLRSKRFIYSGIAVIIAICLVVFSALSVPALRLAIFRSSPTDTSLTEGSTDQHWLATIGGVARVAQNPLGCAPGCAGPASYYSDSPKISENYYVQVAEEVGVVGLVLWVAIVWQVCTRLYAQRKDLLARALLASFVGFSIIGLWLHVWADDPLSLMWWGLAGAVLGYYAHASAKISRT